MMGTTEDHGAADCKPCADDVLELGAGDGTPDGLLLGIAVGGADDTLELGAGDGTPDDALLGIAVGKDDVY